MKNTFKVDNPLLCDPESGICALPDTSTASGETVNIEASDKPVRILYFTDPICSSCWGIEPQLRKMKLEYGDHIDVEYRMGGLLPDWSYNSGGISKPSDVAHHWDEVSGHYDMPIDGDVWLEDPLDSSYPPSIAFKAAQMQSHKKAVRFMRRIREMVFLEKKNISKWEHLGNAAAEVGLNTARMKADYEGKAKELFQEDLNLARQLGVRGFPTLFFANADNQRVTLYGVRHYDNFEKNIQTLAPQTPKKAYEKTPKALFDHYSTLTTNEYATLMEMERSQAEQALETLFEQKLLQKVTTKNGDLWVGKSVRY
ncbi:MAG: ClpXP adapter SpxH family protein [Bacteroidia bacterium]